MRYFIIAFLLVAIAPVSAEPPKDMPKRKPGLWEIKMSTAGGEVLSQHCIDEKTDDLMQQRAQGMGNPECSKNSVRRDGSKVIAESECKLSGTTVATKAVFSGDVLFQDGIGRTDFPGGSYETLMRSIREALFALPDETAVCPGHGPVTTIGRERAENPFLAD